MKVNLRDRKFVRPFVDLLRQGLTAEKLAVTIALGITLGVTPVLGTTVLLCTLAAMVFRLNLAAIQLVNWLVYPLQLILLIPLLRIGAWMFGTQSSELSLSHIILLIRTDIFKAIATLWIATVHALVAWLVFGSIASGIIYLALVPVLRATRRKMQRDIGGSLC